MRKIILIILDGWGWSKDRLGNAVLAANTPNIDSFRKNYPFFLIQASGLAVGLPPLREGNSEVGHLTIGGGRVILQHLTLIDQAIKNGSFFKNETFVRLLNHVQANGSRLHLLGLLGSGTVHSSFEHLLAVIDSLKGKPLETLLHLFTDGKDSGKEESVGLLERVEREIAGTDIKIASIVGRDFAMDRDNNWKLTQKAYELLASGVGTKTSNLKRAAQDYHAQGIMDEIIPPTILDEENVQIEDGDGVLFFNFREDSAKQLARVFTDKNFEFFKTRDFGNLFFATMTNYGEDLNIQPLFKREEVKNTLGEILQKNNKKQLRIAETLKQAHVTYFFNGLREKGFENEVDLLIPSIEDNHSKPEMRASDIMQKTVEEIGRENFEFILVNFANPDILSHTGNLETTIKGIEVIDQALGEIYKAAQKTRATILVTGDHGNAESLTYLGTGEREPRHNLNPVPLYLIDEEFRKGKTEQELEAEEKEIRGILADIAPTILELMGIVKPPEMTGINLIA